MKDDTGKIVARLSKIAEDVTVTRDTYHSLIVERDILIRELLASNMTKTDIANIAGVTRAQVSRMDNGRHS